MSLASRKYCRSFHTDFKILYNSEKREQVWVLITFSRTEKADRALYLETTTSRDIAQKETNLLGGSDADYTVNPLSKEKKKGSVAMPP